jgi:hypothetical protein
MKPIVGKPDPEWYQGQSTTAADNKARLDYDGEADVISGSSGDRKVSMGDGIY